MGDQAEQHQKWWQRIKQHLVTILVVTIILVIVIVLIIIEIRIYGTGFAGKTLWDWLQLLAALAIPVVVGFGAVWFTTRQGKVADAENKDNQRESALQTYIDKMSELLLHEKLRDSAEEDEVRKIARVRTLTVLRGLDPIRKASVIQFLHESGLIDKNKCIISLSGAILSRAVLSRAVLSRAVLSKADLSGANLSGANLSQANFILANLSSTDLRGADLRGADLRGAILSRADLNQANLSDAHLSRADLRGAHLNRAILSRADLNQANLEGATSVNAEELERQAASLKGATMPDGSIHP